MNTPNKVIGIPELLARIADNVVEVHKALAQERSQYAVQLLREIAADALNLAGGLEE